MTGSKSLGCFRVSPIFRVVSGDYGKPCGVSVMKAPYENPLNPYFWGGVAMLGGRVGWPAIWWCGYVSLVGWFLFLDCTIPWGSWLTVCQRMMKGCTITETKHKVFFLSHYHSQKLMGSLGHGKAPLYLHHHLGEDFWFTFSIRIADGRKSMRLVRVVFGLERSWGWWA